MAEPRRAAFPDLPAAKAALIRELALHKQVRDTEQAFVMEGAKPILELFRTKSPAVLAVVVTSSYLETGNHTLHHALEQQGRQVFVCRESVFTKMSDLTTAQGILAVIRKPSWDQDGIFARPQVLGIYGESLQDPTNIGTIVRTAAAFGLDGFWLSTDSADAFNPKIVRATAGTLLKLPIFSIPDASRFTHYACSLLAADASGKRTRRLDEITTIPAKSMIALGNESRGLSQATLEQATLRFHIPISKDVESLNVAASTAIAAFWFGRAGREG
jgi:TrmH family RNA methyltransferase